MSCYKGDNVLACKALKEYHEYQDFRDVAMFEQLPFNGGFRNGIRLTTPYIEYKSKSFFALKYGVTILEMDDHWRCVPDRTSK